MRFHLSNVYLTIFLILLVLFGLFFYVAVIPHPHPSSSLILPTAYQVRVHEGPRRPSVRKFRVVEGVGMCTQGQPSSFSV